MKKIILVLLSLLVLVPGLIACDSNEGKSMLEDVVWHLQSYGKSGDLKAVIKGTEITAEFIGSEKTIKGFTGCNHYSGDYEIKGDKLIIHEGVEVTEIGCTEPEGVMDQEQQYLSLLPLIENYEINRDELRIKCGDHILIFNVD